MKRPLINDQNLNIRTSAKTIKLIKDKMKRNGVKSQSKLVKIAVELLTDDDILQYLLNEVDPKKELGVE